MAANQLDSDTGSEQETHWIPLSDLMTGLMVLFLLIAVTYMIRVEADADRVKEVAIAYSEIKDALYDDLNREFSARSAKLESTTNQGRSFDPLYRAGRAFRRGE